MRSLILLLTLLSLLVGVAYGGPAHDPAVPIPASPPARGRAPTNVAVFVDNLPWGQSTTGDILTA